MTSSKYIRSAAAWRLVQLGDAATGEAMQAAIACLSDASLVSLEVELGFFSQTGFVGIQMSKVVSSLSVQSPKLAA